MLVTMLLLTLSAAPSPDAPAPTATDPTGEAQSNRQDQVDPDTAALLRSPWGEDWKLIAFELGGAVCGGVMCAGFHLPLTCLSGGCWSGVILPAVLGYGIAFNHNQNSEWKGPALWPILGAVALSATWTMIVFVFTVAVSFPLTIAQSSDGNLPVPPRTDALARLTLPGVFSAMLFSLLLSPALSALGAVVAYNVTAELDAEGSDTLLVPAQWPWEHPPTASSGTKAALLY